MSQNQNLVTPKGIAVYPRLGKPDTKFVKEGEFSLKLRLDRNNAEHAEFIEKVEKAHQESIEFGREKLQDALSSAKDASKRGAIKKKLEQLAVADSPFKPVVDDDGNDTSQVEIRFKAKAKFTGKDGDSVTVKFIPCRDAKKNPVDPRTVYVGGGSEVKVAVTMFPYYNAKDNVTGVSFRLRAVQIIKLVQGGGGDFGFEEEDGDEIAQDASDFNDDSEDSDAEDGDKGDGSEF